MKRIRILALTAPVTRSITTPDGKLFVTMVPTGVSMRFDGDAELPLLPWGALALQAARAALVELAREQRSEPVAAGSFSVRKS